MQIERQPEPPSPRQAPRQDPGQTPGQTPGQIDGAEELVLRLQTREVALLLDIFEAALPTEKISGLQTHNPALSHFFNSVYGGLLNTARAHGWGEAAGPGGGG